VQKQRVVPKHGVLHTQEIEQKQGIFRRIGKLYRPESCGSYPPGAIFYHLCDKPDNTSLGWYNFVFSATARMFGHGTNNGLGD
jgi:hypothetical protein